MKTHKYMILGLTLVLMAIISPISAKADIGTDLRYGSKGAEVTELQEFLIDKGLLTGQATGNFFTLTRKAVVAYQASVQLPATGFVGPMTRGEINKELALGTSAEEVASVPVVTPSVDTTVLQNQLILLQQQLAQMQADNKVQAQTQQAKTDQQTQLFGQIVQNTTPILIPVVTAPVVIPPTPEVDKSALIVVGQWFYPLTIDANRPYGVYDFQIKKLDNKGNPVVGAVVTLSTVDNRDLEDNTCYISRGNCQYIPTNPNYSKTITFTSGNLSTSTTIVVQ